MTMIRHHLEGVLFLVLWLGPAASALAAPGDVKRTLDGPCKYPAGLATDGKHLFVVDWRAAKIHQVSAADGQRGKVLDAPTLKPQGLAWGAGRLFVSDDRSGWVYVLDPETGTVEHSFEAPGPRPTGLAYGDDGLFILERKSGQISKVAPDDGTILAYIQTPNDTCTGLTFDGKYLWASDRVKNEIYRVDPASGMVLGILAAPGPYAAGLAWLDGCLWNVDFQTRKMYQIAIKDEQKYRLSDPREARVEYVWAVYNYGPGEIKNVTVNFAVPERLPSQELLSELDYAVPPARLATDRWGQHCAVYELASVPAGTRQVFSYSVKARVSAIHYLIDPAETGTLADIPADLRKAYTVDGARYRIDTPFIKATVKTVVGDEQNPYWIARKIFNYVIDKLEYEMVGGWDIPEVVLKRGKGSCSEYTFAFIALCRAAGLPARYQGSVVVRGDDASVDEAFHRWAEVYLPNYGWVPVDANAGDAKAPADQARGIGERSNRYLITTQGGGDSEYLDWTYNSYAKYQATGYCKVEEENLALWEPLKTADQPAGSTDARNPGPRKPG